MSNETTENFLSVFSNLSEIQTKFPSYKLYYNDQGAPIEYTIEDKPGSYIEVDAPTYMRANTRVKIINGQLVELSSLSYKKLKPSNKGTACPAEDVSIISSPGYTKQTLWSLKVNDTIA